MNDKYRLKNSSIIITYICLNLKNKNEKIITQFITILLLSIFSFILICFNHLKIKMRRRFGVAVAKMLCCSSIAVSCVYVCMHVGVCVVCVVCKLCTNSILILVNLLFVYIYISHSFHSYVKSNAFKFSSI